MTTAPALKHRLRDEDLGFLERAPVVAQREIVIAAPPADVWPAIADVTAWVEWFKGTRAAHYTSAEPIGVGSTRFLKVFTLQVNEVLLAYEADHRYAYGVREANLPVFRAIVEELTLTPEGEGSTRVRFRQAVELAPALKLLGPVVRRQFEAALGRGLRGLAAHIEA